MQVERSAAPRGHRVRLASRVIALFAITLAGAAPALAATLERIKETGRITLGYIDDARPFSYRNESGDAQGYSVELCRRIAEQVNTQLQLPQLTVDWTAVEFDSRLREVQQGGIDLLCAPVSETLSWREQVAFSIPIFAGGNRAVLRTDARVELRNALDEDPRMRPVWRGSPAALVLQGTSFAVVSGSTTEKWLKGRRDAFRVDAKIVPVPDYRTGLQLLLERKVDVFFGERSVVLGVLSTLDSSARQSLTILDRLFTHEPLSLALARNDDDFRLLVDRALSHVYASSEFRDLYRKWFGEFDENTRRFFLWNTPGE